MWTSMLRLVWILALSLIPVGILSAQSRNLDIYWIDVEGGGATLIVSPSGESLLIDAGWEVGDDRDPKRIFAVTQQIGLKKIDYFMLTHYHADHAGGLPALAKMIPIGKCLDRGNTIEPENRKWFDAYTSACASKRTIVKAGDKSYEIPYAEAFLQSVDLKQKQIHMQLPEGLLEVNAPLTEEEKQQQRNKK